MSPSHQGDDGYTGLLGSERVPKYDARMEALGTLDEVNAALGLARSYCQDPVSAEILLQVQRDIYSLMGEVAATAENAAQFRVIDAAKVAWIEEQEKLLLETVTPPKEFIVPGDTLAGSFIDLARTIVRRAERRIVELAHQGILDNPDILRYLNRLSTLIFALELFENQVAGYSNPTLAKKESE